MALRRLRRESGSNQLQHSPIPMQHRESLPRRNDLRISFNYRSKKSRNIFGFILSVVALRTLRHLFPTLITFGSQAKQSLWIPLTEEEYINFTSSSRLARNPCKQPFSHCCIGQCRQAHYELNERDSMYKYNGSSAPLATFSDVLDYYHDHYTMEQSKSCNIVFIGDSLSSDHAMGAACDLIGKGYDLISCNNAYFGFHELYGEDRNVTCMENLYPHFGHHVLENRSAKSCPRVTIGSILMTNNTADILREAREVHENGGLIIFNWGVHCNSKKENCIINALTSSILPMLRGDKSTQYSQWKFLYRETEPQHFSGPGGLYHSDSFGKKASCYADEVDNWRNEEVQDFMSLHNLTHDIPTIEIFRPLSTLYQLHHPPDCTHYCYNPLRLDVTWDSMLRVLERNKEL